MRVKYLSINSPYAKWLESYPSFHISGSIKGMKDKFYGKNALLVRCGQWIYNVTECPSIYYGMAK